MNKFRLMVACCLMASGYGQKQTAPAVSAPVVSSEASVAEVAPPGPRLVSPQNCCWMPRSAADGHQSVRWEFDWGGENGDRDISHDGLRD